MSENTGAPKLTPAGDHESSDEVSAQSVPSARASAEELVVLARLRAGDESAFATIVDDYHGALLRLAQVFVSSKAVAEEVVQETWTAVLGGLASFEGRSSLKTWIFRILANRAKTRGIREGRSVPFSALGDTDGDDGPAAGPSRFKPNGSWAEPPRQWDEETPEKLMMRRELVALLSSAVERLPPNQRAIISLRDVDGLDSTEVCNILQISETNQRVLLHRARAKLRSALEEHVGA